MCFWCIFRGFFKNYHQTSFYSFNTKRTISYFWILSNLALMYNSFYNYWLKRLNTQLSEPTNQNSIKSPQSFLRSLQRIRKHYHKTLGTKVINSPMSPPSPTTILFFFQRKRWQWAVYYTSPQIIIKMFSYSLAFQLWAL